MPAPKPTKVYAIPGRFAHERLEDHEVESVEEANRLVATGAFALSAKEANDQAFSTPEAKPASDENVKKPRSEPAAALQSPPAAPAETAAEE